MSDTIPKTKKFNGKIFILKFVSSKKDFAMKKQKWAKRAGRLARIVKYSGPKYAVYER